MLPVFAFLLNGCSSIYYFYQAGKGQLALLNRGKPIEKVISDPAIDPKLASLLSNIKDIRKFCEDSGLMPTPNYREYVSLDRDSVVYVVTVSEALEFKVKIFSFPIAGSFNYIGWFSKDDALEFAKKFEAQGMDVDVRGASAYSTLGWFRDPLLSTMIPIENGVIQAEALADLVNVVIHESVHATLYLKNQSYFNESIAVFVADELTRKYFESKLKMDAPEWKSYLSRKDRGEKIRTRMMKAYADLKVIYDSSMPTDEKRSKKKIYLEALQKELNFRRPITNATLIQFQTYNDSEHGFQPLYEKMGRNLNQFMAALSQLKPSDFKKDHDESFDVSKMIR